LFITISYSLTGRELLNLSGFLGYYCNSY